MKENKDVIIVLSPHFDDAALPLGGMLSQSTSTKITVTFFTNTSSSTLLTHWDKISGFESNRQAVLSRMRENISSMSFLGTQTIDAGFLDMQYRNSDGYIAESDAKLESDIYDFIDSILSKQDTNSHISVYGPAYFGETITHPDHFLVNKVLVDIFLSKKYPNISFYMYEDQPYAAIYDKSTTTPIIKTLEERYPNLTFDEKDIMLNKLNIRRKLQSIGDYRSQMKAFKNVGENVSSLVYFYAEKRCVHSPCEVVYLLGLK